LMRAWRISKLFPDRSKYFTLANQVRTIGSKSFDMLQYDRIRCSVFADLDSNSSPLSCLENDNLWHETRTKLSSDNITMLFGNRTVPQLCSSNSLSRTRIWIEYGNSKPCPA
jgi:hypothetical protein